MFSLTEERLPTSPFFVVKQGTLSANAARLLGNLADARTRPLWRILVALSIRHVGPPRPARWRPSSARWTPSKRRARTRWPRSTGWGRRSPRRSRLVRRGLASRHRGQVAGAGVRLPRSPTRPDPTAARLLDGVTVVITGTLPGFSREEAAEAVRARAAR